MDNHLFQSKNDSDNESNEINFTSKIMKSCIKCIRTIIQHVENVISISDGLFVVNNSSIIEATDGQNIEIEEHNIKQDPDELQQYLQNIKKCFLDLSLISMNQGIFVQCDLTFEKIGYYCQLRNSNPIVDYLSENIFDLNKQIGCIVDLLKSKNDLGNVRDIRKSISKINKHVTSIPKLDLEKSESSRQYAECIQNFIEKLKALRTGIIKLRKAFTKQIFKVDLTNPPELSSKKHENDLETVNNPTNLEETNKNAKTNKRKKQKHNKTNELNALESNEESASIKKKKKKHDNKESESVSLYSDMESVKAKKKRQNIDTEQNPAYCNSHLPINNDTESIKSKSKHKNKTKENKNCTEIENNHLITSEIIEKEEKHRNNGSKSENKEHNSSKECQSTDSGLEIKPDDTKKKKKRKKNKSESDWNETQIVPLFSDTENVERIDKKKERVENENRKEYNYNKEDQSPITGSESESKKKKKKLKSATENDGSRTVLLFSDIEDSKSDDSKLKRTKKTKQLNKISNYFTLMPEKIDLRDSESPEHITNNLSNSAEIFKTPEKKKNAKRISSNYNQHLCDTTNIFKTPEKIKTTPEKNIFKTPEKKKKTKRISESSTSSPEKNRSRNDSESSIISLGRLYTSHIDVGEENISFSAEQTSDIEEIVHVAEKMKNNKEKYVSAKAKKKNSKNHSEHEVFGDLIEKSVDLDQIDASVILEQLAREDTLSENEQFLYLQDLLLQAEENNQLSANLIEKIKDLSIIIDWDIHPAHQIERRISSTPTASELATLKALGVTDKRYNKDESKLIQKNWEKFCKVHGLENDPRPFLSLRHRKKVIMKYAERKKFVQFLGRGLPNRALNSIYRRFKAMYKDRSRLGRFSPEEDKLILTYCEKSNHSRKFAKLANILQRDRAALEKRYRTLKKNYNERIKWSLEIESVLVNGLLKAIGSKNVEDLEHAALKRDHFIKVAAELKMPWDKIRIHWLKHIYAKLFAKRRLHSGEIQYEIYQVLSEKGQTDWKKIDWSELTEHFQGFTKEFLQLQVMILQYKAVPKEYHKNLGKTLTYCKEHIKMMAANGKEPFSKRIIKKYKWEDGQLIEID